MKRYPLTEYLNLPGKTQASVAAELGLTQGAVSQAKLAVEAGKKQVYIIVDGSSVSMEYVRAAKKTGAAA